MRLESLSKLDRDRFWSRIKRKMRRKIIFESEINDLKKEFENLFNDKLTGSSNITKQSNEKIDEFTQNNKEKIFD